MMYSLIHSLQKLFINFKIYWLFQIYFCHYFIVVEFQSDNFICIILIFKKFIRFTLWISVQPNFVKLLCVFEKNVFSFIAKCSRNSEIPVWKLCCSQNSQYSSQFVLLFVFCLTFEILREMSQNHDVFFSFSLEFCHFFMYFESTFYLHLH